MNTITQRQLEYLVQRHAMQAQALIIAEVAIGGVKRKSADILLEKVSFLKKPTEKNQCLR